MLGKAFEIAAIITWQIEQMPPDAPKNSIAQEKNKWYKTLNPATKQLSPILQ